MPEPAPRLLLDENLSRRLVAVLDDVYPGSQHVVAAGLGSASDADVWEHARLHGLVIVTKDAEFHQRSFLLGAPPKVVWLRLGNCTTDAVARALLGRASAIRAFVADADASFLELS